MKERMLTSETDTDPLFHTDVIQDPYDYYRHLRKNDPVHEVAGTGTYLVTRREIIYDVVAQPAVFSSEAVSSLHYGDWAAPALRPTGYSTGVLGKADPPEHTRQRKVSSRKLSNTYMRAMESEYRSLIEAAMVGIPADGRFEWMSRVAEPLPMVMVSRILGLPDAIAPDLKKHGYARIERIGGFVSEDRIKQIEDVTLNHLAALADVKHPAALVEAYTTARADAAAYSGTLIGIVAQAVADGELNDSEAMGILQMIISAGGESTTSLIGTGVRLLAERPDLQDQLRIDPSLVPAFVEEACRLDAPFRGHYRIVTQDVELAGKRVPAGSQLLLIWPAANRDETAYDKPDEVQLDRPNPRHHVGFGWGIHLCVGAPLARMEAKVTFETLLARTRTFRIEPSAPPLQYHLSLFIRRLVSLPLILELAE